ncbi:hypothetical protein DFH09DRAFT_1067444 [Mycena vulgaris]|nr:hypothetical protein DFH09DRAFT_1067444 [Mycena vulgaris]
MIALQTRRKTETMWKGQGCHHWPTQGRHRARHVENNPASLEVIWRGHWADYYEKWTVVQSFFRNRIVQLPIVAPTRAMLVLGGGGTMTKTTGRTKSMRRLGAKVTYIKALVVFFWLYSGTRFPVYIYSVLESPPLRLPLTSVCAKTETELLLSSSRALEVSLLQKLPKIAQNGTYPNPSYGISEDYCAEADFVVGDAGTALRFSLTTGVTGTKGKWGVTGDEGGWAEEDWIDNGSAELISVICKHKSSSPYLGVGARFQNST